VDELVIENNLFKSNCIRFSLSTCKQASRKEYTRGAKKKDFDKLSIFSWVTFDTRERLKSVAGYRMSQRE
jgi:hypothetical protein